MFQNIKVDVIYYKTNTDFEMEFNLCGCCRMRLLTDKASNGKLLVENLSRAVSRSKIIIVVGNLFGEDNIVSSVSTAIGKKTTITDNKTYGINSSEDINIINGSTPLVTSDGVFGGCIIESGPQTLILLSESKNVRKPIMNSLIHPYLSDLYTAMLAEETAKKEQGTAENAIFEAIEEPIENTEEMVEDIIAENLDSELETVTEEIAETETIEDVETEEELDEVADEVREKEEIVEEPDDYIETETKEEIVTKEKITETEEQEDDLDIEEENINLFAESKKIRRREAKFYNEAYSDFDVTGSGLIDDSDDFEYFHKSFPKLRVTILVLSILILIALVILCYCIFYVPSKDGVSAAAYIREIYNTLFG